MPIVHKLSREQKLTIENKILRMDEKSKFGFYFTFSCNFSKEDTCYDIAEWTDFGTVRTVW